MQAGGQHRTKGASSNADAHFTRSLRPHAADHLPPELRMAAPRTRNLKSMPLNWRTKGQSPTQGFLPRLDKISPSGKRRNGKSQSMEEHSTIRSPTKRQELQKQSKLRKAGDPLFEKKPLTRKQFASTRSKMMDRLKTQSPYAIDPRQSRYGKDVMISSLMTASSGQPDYNKIGNLAFSSGGLSRRDKHEADISEEEKEKLKLQTSHAAWGSQTSPKNSLFSSAALILHGDASKVPETKTVGEEKRGVVAEVRPFYMKVLEGIDNKQKERLNTSTGMELELSEKPERVPTKEEVEKEEEAQAKIDAAAASKAFFAEVEGVNREDAPKDAADEKEEEGEQENDDKDVFGSVIENKEIDDVIAGNISKDPLKNTIRRVEILEAQLAQSRKETERAKLDAKKHLKFARVSKREFEQQMIDSLHALRETEQQLENAKAELEKIGKAREEAQRDAESAHLETAAMQEKLKDMRQEQEKTLALLLKTNRELDAEDPLRAVDPVSQDADSVESIEKQILAMKKRQRGSQKAFEGKLDVLRNEFFEQQAEQRLAHQAELDFLRKKLEELEVHNKKMAENMAILAQIDNEVANAEADAQHISQMTGQMKEQSAKNTLIELLEQALKHGASDYIEATLEAAMAFDMQPHELLKYNNSMHEARRLERLAKNALAERLARLEMRETGFKAKGDLKNGRAIEDDQGDKCKIDLFKVDPRVCPIAVSQPICMEGKTCKCENQGMDISILRTRLQKEKYCPLKVTSEDEKSQAERTNELDLEVKTRIHNKQGDCDATTTSTESIVKGNKHETTGNTVAKACGVCDEAATWECEKCSMRYLCNDCNDELHALEKLKSHKRAPYPSAAMGTEKRKLEGPASTSGAASATGAQNCGVCDEPALWICNQCPDKHLCEDCNKDLHSSEANRGHSRSKLGSLGPIKEGDAAEVKQRVVEPG